MRRRPARLAPVSIAALVLALHGSVPCGAGAQDRPRVVVIASESPLAREALVHLRAELELMALELVELTGTPAPTRSPADAEASPARAQGAVAALALVAVEDHLVVWIDDAATGKVVWRPLPPGLPATDVALRAVELLHASLLELSTRAPRAEEGSAREVLRRSAPPRPRDPSGVAARAAFGVASAVGGPDAAPRARLDVVLRVDPVLALVAGGSFVAPSSIAGDGALAEVGSADVGLAVEVRVAAGELVAIDLGARASALLVWGAGLAGPDLEPRSAATGALLLSGLARALVRVQPNVALFVDGEVGGSVPSVPIQFAGIEVGLAASPLLAASIGLEVRLSP